MPERLVHVHAEPVGDGAPDDEGLGELVADGADTRPLVSPHVHGLANRLEDLAGLLAEHEAGGADIRILPHPDPPPRANAVADAGSAPCAANASTAS
jgi:hypothetical protein